jgi:hypothetical protein
MILQTTRSQPHNQRYCPQAPQIRIGLKLPHRLHPDDLITGPQAPQIRIGLKRTGRTVFPAASRSPSPANPHRIETGYS